MAAFGALGGRFLELPESSLSLLPAAPWLPAVLIDRGWKAHDMHGGSRVGAAPPPSGLVTVEGLAVTQPSALLELGGKSERRVPGIWHNLDYAAYEQATGRSVARFVIRLSSDVPSGNATDGLRREWPRPASGVEKHRGYALQWYSLAALVTLLWLGLNFRRTPS